MTGTQRCSTIVNVLVGTTVLVFLMFVFGAIQYACYYKSFIPYCIACVQRGDIAVFISHIGFDAISAPVQEYSDPQEGHPSRPYYVSPCLHCSLHINLSRCPDESRSV
ncbi:hypothetical protein BJ742DRAFT_475350 [Cladochytrium replicatum]|nr:hypothetical protein BJ742DRAFT_475350 [Cladochytrium replicatum]